jgi:hypothetical protein
MILVTKRINKEIAHQSSFPDAILAEVCLEVAGGGYTTGQTAAAMQLRQQVEEHGSGKLGKVTVTKE